MDMSIVVVFLITFVIGGVIGGFVVWDYKSMIIAKKDRLIKDAEAAKASAEAEGEKFKKDAKPL
jgi:hypothetical protein